MGAGGSAKTPLEKFIEKDNGIYNDFLKNYLNELNTLSAKFLADVDLEAVAEVIRLYQKTNIEDIKESLLDLADNKQFEQFAQIQFGEIRRVEDESLEITIQTHQENVDELEKSLTNLRNAAATVQSSKKTSPIEDLLRSMSDPAALASFNPESSDISADLRSIYTDLVSLNKQERELEEKRRLAKEQRQQTSTPTAQSLSGNPTVKQVPTSAQPQSAPTREELLVRYSELQIQYQTVLLENKGNQGEIEKQGTSVLQKIKEMETAFDWIKEEYIKSSFNWDTEVPSLAANEELRLAEEKRMAEKAIPAEKAASLKRFQQPRSDTQQVSTVTSPIPTANPAATTRSVERSSVRSKRSFPKAIINKFRKIGKKTLAHKAALVKQMVDKVKTQDEGKWLKEEGVFRQGGSASRINTLLKGGKPNDTFGVHDYVGALKKTVNELGFKIDEDRYKAQLMSLREAYTLASGSNKAIDAQNAVSAFNSLVEALANSDNKDDKAYAEIIHQYLHLMAKTQEHATDNKMPAANLALIIGPIISKQFLGHEDPMEFLLHSKSVPTVFENVITSDAYKQTFEERYASPTAQQVLPPTKQSAQTQPASGQPSSSEARSPAIVLSHQSGSEPALKLPPPQFRSNYLKNIAEGDFAARFATYTSNSGIPEGQRSKIERDLILKCEEKLVNIAKTIIELAKDPKHKVEAVKAWQDIMNIMEKSPQALKEKFMHLDGANKMPTEPMPATSQSERKSTPK